MRFGDATTRIPRSIRQGSHVRGEDCVSVDAGQRRHPWYDRGAWDSVRGVAERRSGNHARNTHRIRRWSGSSHRTRRRCNVGRQPLHLGPIKCMSNGCDTSTPHINNCSQVMVLAWRQWVCKYRLQANAIVIWSKGSSPALASNSPLNVIQPCFRSRTSDFQYSRSSRRKSNT